MRLTNVKCSVRNCAYWGRGDVCQADSIEVAVTGSPGARTDFDAAAGAFQAPTSEWTCCVTFKPRAGA